MSQPALNPMFGTNKLKIGTFTTNSVNMLTVAPEISRPSWTNCLAAAKLADGAGFETITPVARWKGYVDGNVEHPSHEVVEAFTFAAAIAQATHYSAIVATSHAPTIHPVAVAKQCATIDHISNGRFVLNAVSGWNRREFDMFGINLLEHSERYQYLDEWLMLLRRLWTGEEFNFRSGYFNLKAALCRPVPLQRRIPVMNAGLSSVGMRFAAHHADIAFRMPAERDPRMWRQEVIEYKQLALNEFGREIKVWTNASVIQAKTQEEAEALRVRYSETMVDREALQSIITSLVQENGWTASDTRIPLMRQRLSCGAGYPLIGTADRIAEQLQAMADSGIDGVLLSWANFLPGLSDFIQEVLPRLERAGLRAPFEMG